MSYKGINTNILEMKEKHMLLVNESLQNGIPLAVIQIMLENLMMNIEASLNQNLSQEKEQYEKELKNESEKEEPVSQS